MQPGNDPLGGFDEPARRYLAELGLRRPVALVPRPGHVQVRPAQKGAIALRVLPARIEIAIAPAKAVATAATITGATVLEERKQTWFIRVSSTDILRNNMDHLLDVGAAAVDWRAREGPQTTPADGRRSQEPAPPRLCPVSGCGYVLSANGKCPACDE